MKPEGYQTTHILHIELSIILLHVTKYVLIEKHSIRLENAFYEQLLINNYYG